MPPDEGSLPAPELLFPRHGGRVALTPFEAMEYRWLPVPGAEAYEFHQAPAGETPRLVDTLRAAMIDVGGECIFSMEPPPPDRYAWQVVALNVDGNASLPSERRDYLLVRLEPQPEPDLIPAED